MRAAGAAGVTEVRLGFRDPPQRHRRGGGERKCRCLKKELRARRDPGPSNISKAQKKRAHEVLDTWIPTARTGLNCSVRERDPALRRDKGQGA